MIRYLAVILLGLGMSSLAPTSFVNPGTKTDGEWWKRRSEAQKIGYVTGWRDGEISVVFREYLNDRPRTTEQPLQGCVERREKLVGIPRNYTVNQFADGIDHFYADYRNGLVQVPEIAEEVEKQINGASDAEIEADLELL